MPQSSPSRPVSLSFASGQHFSHRPVGFTAFVYDTRSAAVATNGSTDGKQKTSSTQHQAAELTKRWHALSATEQSRYAAEEEKTAAMLALADFDTGSADAALPAPPAADVPDIPIGDLPSYPGPPPGAPLASVSPSSASSSTFLSSSSLTSQRPSPVSTPSSFSYDPLNLSNLRNVLIRLEESIIFALIERAQFRLNSPIYSPAAMPQFHGLSFLSFFLYETEILHAKVRRYTSPDEHPFADPSLLPSPILPPLAFPPTLKANDINVNRTIYQWYVETVLPSITRPGDDSHYGSAATADITALQLLSKRIHYGKFVAESKFRSDPESFTRAILDKDLARLMELITIPVVEEQVVQRVHLKAATYGSEPGSATPRADGPAAAAAGTGELSIPSSGGMQHSRSFPNSGGVREPDSGGSGGGMRGGGAAVLGSVGDGKYKISPDTIASIYVAIIALNKEVQIEYLLNRLG
jgi:chorismate mutase